MPSGFEGLPSSWSRFLARPCQRSSPLEGDTSRPGGFEWACVGACRTDGALCLEGDVADGRHAVLYALYRALSAPYSPMDMKIPVLSPEVH
jgi:hypothetical protein